MSPESRDERTKAAVPSAEAQSLRVLVVEDDASLRDIIVEALESEGHVVRATDDGAEALRLIAESAPHVVLLDMVMPQASVDGFEFIARLKTAPAEVREVPLVLLSALGPSLSAAIDARSASALNIVWVVSKPCDLSELLSVTRAAGQRRGSRRATS
jgi:CheY-like chemotaxis protein